MRERGVYRILYLLFALGSAHLLLLCGVEAQRWIAQRQELRLVAGQTEALAAKVANLREELARADDPAYLEEKARSLGYVYPDEVLHAEPR
ncbi:FtsB family cell division protein [Oceanithermus sp.]